MLVLPPSAKDVRVVTIDVIHTNELKTHVTSDKVQGLFSSRAGMSLCGFAGHKVTDGIQIVYFKLCLQTDLKRILPSRMSLLSAII